MSGKKVISFGSWGYLTEPGTYDILSQAMNPTNRATFAYNVAKFLADEGLDGADFDWEYPSNPDIEGAIGKPEDVLHYLRFLTALRTRLKDTGRTLSIAAPASFWYLKPFPIKQMAEQLDYIVFMIYDLHG
jgi:GH18 family chitinase